MIIGNDVWIGYGVVIMLGLIIKDGVIIVVGVVVIKDVDYCEIVVGILVKVVFRCFDSDVNIVEYLFKI